MTKKKKRNARERRTLVGAMCVAAVIVAGSTFAWFTSQDDVTNRLTAKGNYGVAIAETFVPPTNLVPGQEVTKEVMATNTGNIPALVRLGLNNSVSGWVLDSGTVTTSGGTTTLPETAVQLGDYDYAKAKANNTTSTKPNSYTAPTSTGESAATNAFYNELADVMAGGYLVYTPAISSGAKVEFSNPAGGTDNKVTLTTQVNSITNGQPVTAGWVLNEDAPEGYYIFRRQVDITNASYTYSGFYFKGGKYYRLAMTDGDDTFGGANTASIPNGNQPADKSAHIPTTDAYTISGSSFTVVNAPLVTIRQLDFTTRDKLSATGANGTRYRDTISAVLWNNATAPGTAANTETVLNEVLVTVNVGNDTDTANDLKFHLALTEAFKLSAANSDKFESYLADGSTKGHWTAVLDDTFSPIKWTQNPPFGSGTANLGYIYYNDKLDPGETTPKLIDSVTLDENTKGTYVEITYDIDVLLDSIQISYDNANNEVAPGDTPSVFEAVGESDPAVYKSSTIDVGGWGVTATVFDDKSTNGEITDRSGANTGVEWILSGKSATSGS